MKKSTYTPTITVDDDDKIEVDFADSFQNTYDGEEFSDDDGGSRSALLDSLVVGVDTPTALRQLADHIGGSMTLPDPDTIRRIRERLADIDASDPAEVGRELDSICSELDRMLERLEQ